MIPHHVRMIPSSDSHHFEITENGTKREQQNASNKTSVGSETIAAQWNAGNGSGIVWDNLLATSNVALAIRIAVPMAALSNVSLRKVI